VLGKQSFIEVRLKEILDDELDSKPYKLQLVLAGRVREGTIYDLYHGRSKSIKIQNLAHLVDGLNELAKQNNIDKEYTIEDIFVHRR
jgi:hypothetical protein